jgi:hypothetical protein
MLLMLTMLVACKHRTAGTGIPELPTDSAPPDTTTPPNSPRGDILLTRTLVGSGLGSALAVTGDLDGDGHDNLLVGALEAGQVWLLAIDATDLASAPVLSAPGAGGSLASTGDLDGDGYGDVLIGGAGSAWRAHGPLSGNITLTDGWHSEVEDTDRVTVAAAGDLTGDGRPDLLLAAPRSDLGAEDAGAIWLLDGRAEPGDAAEQAAATILGTIAHGFAGYALDGAGDTNGDGVTDLVVGAWGADGFRGHGYLLHGPLTGSSSLADADQQWTGDEGWDVAGWSVSGAGDVDGDGRDEVILGAYGVDGAAWSVGAAYLVSDGQSIHDADAILLGSVGDDRAGWSVDGVGDLDEDGHADLLIGGPGLDLGATDAGGAWLVYGPVSGIVSLDDADARLFSDVPAAAAGSAVAGGRGRLLIGAPEADTLYLLP